MLANKPRTKILVDGGDPKETLRIKTLIGFVDGQTTNPSLIAKNPEIQRLLASGHRLSSQEEKDEYRKIAQSISPLVGDAGVSIEVFADLATTAEESLPRARKCLPGFRMHTSSIPARTKVCEPHRSQCK